MRARLLRSLLAGVAIVSGAWLALPSRDADAVPMGSLDVAQVTCGPPNLALAQVKCGQTGIAVRAQNRTTTSVYFGGGSNFTGANRTWGQEHCSGCADGPRFAGDMKTGGSPVAVGDLRCIAEASTDAGVVIEVLCGK